MKLEPGERSILASFPSSTRAESAVAALKQAGFTGVQLDRVGRYGYSADAEQVRPIIAGKESSQTNAVLGPENLDDESRILLGATPAASGMAGDFTMDEMPFLVTVVTSEGRLRQAVGLIEKHGGRA